MSRAEHPPSRSLADPADLPGRLPWRLVGPWRGGRVTAVAGHPDDPAVFFFGSTGGGVWRSGNAGEQEVLHSPVGLDAKLAALGYWLAKSDSAPTRQMEAVFADLAARAGGELARLRELDATERPAAERALREAGLPGIV